MNRDKILVVEPDDDIRNMLDLMLSNAEFTITTAKNAREGRELIPKVIPQLVIIEPDLPDGDGYDLLRDLHKTKSTARIPAIITKRDPLRAEKLQEWEGYIHYLAKPFPPIDDFVLRIQDIITPKGVLITRPINRITQLPNGVGVEERLRELLDEKRTDWAYIDIKIQGFKSYTEIHSWQRSDELVRKMGELLREIVAQHGTKQDFIGHIGHVNFTICTYIPDYNSLVAELQKQFDKRVLIDTEHENAILSLVIGIADMRESFPKGFPEMIDLVLRLRDGMDKDKPDDIATAW